jgi:hypothetical protein
MQPIELSKLYDRPWDEIIFNTGPAHDDLRWSIWQEIEDSWEFLFENIRDGVENSTTEEWHVSLQWVQRKVWEEEEWM